jgi:hypothetical protein
MVYRRQERGVSKMKVAELINILEKYDPLDDVVISSNHYGKYRNFIVKEHGDQAITKGRTSVVALEVSDEVGEYIIIVKD